MLSTITLTNWYSSSQNKVGGKNYCWSTSSPLIKQIDGFKISWAGSFLELVTGFHSSPRWETPVARSVEDAVDVALIAVPWTVNWGSPQMIDVANSSFDGIFSDRSFVKNYHADSMFVRTGEHICRVASRLANSIVNDGTPNTSTAIFSNWNLIQSCRGCSLSCIPHMRALTRSSIACVKILINPRPPFKHGRQSMLAATWWRTRVSRVRTPHKGYHHFL